LRRGPRALEIDPNDTLSLTNLATLLGNLHDYPNAAMLYDRVIQLRPGECSIGFLSCPSNALLTQIM
jgi:hypothetical protein